MSPVAAALLLTKLRNMLKIKLRLTPNWRFLAHPFAVDSFAYQFTDGVALVTALLSPSPPSAIALWREYLGGLDGQEYEFDRIWLATGTKLDATTEPLLTRILDIYPIPIVKGLPVLDEYLRWPGCELFVMGGLAALQVGPTARNLYGARMASDRIVPAMVKSSLSLVKLKSA
ncbi:hypothetical protein MiSe_62950 [Microseira wollei NIES-4236]|uniref:FAD dependent oxidoreductase n=2 Tax=Microseira wollei TaxID=467598 RepID=A0AAV3XFX0_9CYAN|nr:hypothetical protein MiSe_62950 [Microseira wollei NIES-4236]